MCHTERSGVTLRSQNMWEWPENWSSIHIIQSNYNKGWIRFGHTVYVGVRWKQLEKLRLGLMLLDIKIYNKIQLIWECISFNHIQDKNRELHLQVWESWCVCLCVCMVAGGWVRETILALSKITLQTEVDNTHTYTQTHTDRDRQPLWLRANWWLAEAETHKMLEHLYVHTPVSWANFPLETLPLCASDPSPVQIRRKIKGGLLDRK